MAKFLTQGLTQGGKALAISGSSVSLASGVAIVDFGDLSFTGATITARGALIYNTTTGAASGTTDAVVVLDFGGNKLLLQEHLRFSSHHLQHQQLY